MLKKLFKYDFRATIGTILPLSLAPIPLAVILGLCIGWITGTDSSAWTAIPTAFAALAGIAIYACPIVVSVSLYVRYYRSFFSDEGYLTMSLPVTSKKLVLSKLLFTAMYEFIIALSLIISFALIFAVCDLILDEQIYFYMIRAVSDLFRQFISSSPLSILHIALFSVEGILILFAGAFSSAMVIFCSITLGSLIFKRHHFLGTILFYLIISNVLSVVNLVTYLFTTVAIGMDLLWVIHIKLMITSALLIGIGIGLYFFVSWLIEKKLNLN